jgi:hypothetical protein
MASNSLPASMSSRFFPKLRSPPTSAVDGAKCKCECVDASLERVSDLEPQGMFTFARHRDSSLRALRMPREAETERPVSAQWLHGSPIA